MTMDSPRRVTARVRLMLRAEKAFGTVASRKSGIQPAPATVARPDRAVAPGTAQADLATANRSSTHQTVKPPSPATVRPAPDPAKPLMPTMFGGPDLSTPPLDRAQRVQTLQILDQTQVRGCKRCVLHERRTQTVFGEGDVQAELMFIGEGPGESEDLSGRPFVGRAGKKLDEQIAAMGLTRSQVYIANVVKCRPPGNRTPTTAEAQACGEFLMRQIEVIRPKVIVALGFPATRLLLNVNASMGSLRGRFHDFHGIAVMPTYHPSYLLRNPTIETRRAVWSDLQMVMRKLGLPLPARPTNRVHPSEH